MGAANAVATSKQHRNSIEIRIFVPKVSLRCCFSCLLFASRHCGSWSHFEPLLAAWVLLLRYSQKGYILYSVRWEIGLFDEELVCFPLSTTLDRFFLPVRSFSTSYINPWVLRSKYSFLLCARWGGGSESVDVNFTLGHVSPKYVQNLSTLSSNTLAGLIF